MDRFTFSYILHWTHSLSKISLKFFLRQMTSSTSEKNVVKGKGKPSFNKIECLEAGLMKTFFFGDGKEFFGVGEWKRERIFYEHVLPGPQEAPRQLGVERWFCMRGGEEIGEDRNFAMRTGKVAHVARAHANTDTHACTHTHAHAHTRAHTHTALLGDSFGLPQIIMCFYYYRF